TNVFSTLRPAPIASREYANSTIARTKAVAWKVASDHVTSFIALPVRQPHGEGEDHREGSARRSVQISERRDRAGCGPSGRGADARHGERARERKHDQREDRAELEKERGAPVRRRPQKSRAECGEVADSGHREHA